MAFTYDGTLDTDLEKVRLEIGDTDSTAALFTDAEITYFLDREVTVLKAAAAACDSLARKFARAYDFETDAQRFHRSQMTKQYAQLAKELRKRQVGVSTVATTRVDGYSDNIAYDETTATTNTRGRVKAGWFDPDLPH